MARSRNIKPALFKNELLGVEDPMLTILFVSLWCLADKSGRIEDRPLRIKAETFPYRENIDINGYLTELERLEFIHRYTCNGTSIIQVVNFNKHQNPHKTEKDSDLPEYSKESCSCPLTVRDTLNNGSRPADSLNIDSLNIDSLNTAAPEKKDKKENPLRKLLPEISEQVFNDFLAHRKHKKALITETAIEGIKKEADKAGVSLETALKECCARGWVGFKADWYSKNSINGKTEKFDPVAYVNRNRIRDDDESDCPIIDI